MSCLCPICMFTLYMLCYLNPLPHHVTRHNLSQVGIKCGISGLQLMPTAVVPSIAIFPQRVRYLTDIFARLCQTGLDSSIQAGTRHRQYGAWGQPPLGWTVFCSIREQYSSSVGLHPARAPPRGCVGRQVAAAGVVQAFAGPEHGRYQCTVSHSQ